MNENQLLELLEQVRAGTLHPDDAAATLSRLPFADLGHARIDHHRALRTGRPEAIYAPGKAVEHCVEIVGEFLANGTGPVILTRADTDQADAVIAAHPGATIEGSPAGSTVIWRPSDPRPAGVVVATAGTADLPVADEAVAVLTAHGIEPTRVHDVGVAGLHRLLAEVDTIATAEIVITVAGMEGALATAIGGLTAAPVIAVPSSVGYGAGLDGVTALLAMHAACSAGITVVGIDNGFGAAMAALRILDRMAP